MSFGSKFFLEENSWDAVKWISWYLKGTFVNVLVLCQDIVAAIKRYVEMVEKPLDRCLYS